MLTDYDFVKDPAKAGDTRWVHRPKMKWEFLEELDNTIQSGGGSIRRPLFKSLQHPIHIRKSLPALAGQQMNLMKCDNAHLLGFVRIHQSHRMVETHLK